MQLTHFLIYLFSVLLLANTTLWSASPDRQSSIFTPKIRAVVEMEPIDHVINGSPISFAERDAVKEFSLDLKIIWDGHAPKILGQINAELIQSISKWARKEMRGLKIDPFEIPLDFKPLHWIQGRQALLYEATLTNLPSHHPLVSRWLKLFLAYKPYEPEILEVILTIQGELLE